MSTTSIIQQIITKNVITYKIQHNIVEENFEIIRKALKDQSDLIILLSNNHNELREQHTSQANLISQLENEQTQMQNKQNGMEKEIQQLRDQLKHINSQNQDIARNKVQGANPEENAHSPHAISRMAEETLGQDIAYCKEQIKLIQERLGINQQELLDCRKHMNSIEKGTEANHKEIIDFKAETIQKIQWQKEKYSNLSQQLSALNTHLQSDEADSWKQKSQRQEETQLQILSLLEELRKKQAETQKELQAISNQQYLTTQELETQKRQSTKLERGLLATKDSLFRIQKDNLEKIGNEEAFWAMKKDINQLKELMRKDNSVYVKLEASDTKISGEKTQTKIMEAEDEFRKKIIDRLQNTRGELFKALKRMDTGSTYCNSQTDRIKLDELEMRVARLQHLMNGKVDTQTLKKLLGYLEDKLNYLFKVINAPETEEDARIAKRKWNCLSCDKKLTNYSGKIGSHLVNGQLKAKLLDQEIAGGGMLFKSKSKYELPAVGK